jgi:predicted NAD/FAD-binding protein
MATIAIIGTGISGMSAAALLHKSNAITVYEKSPEIGGHTRTRTIQYNDKTISVDTGFIVFNHRNYPNLTAMFRHYGVPVQKSDMTFGITIDNGNIEWGARNLNAVFGQRRNLFRPKFIRFLLDILRFNKLAYDTAEANPGLTMRGLLDILKLSDWFRDYYILPMGGAIWSCSLEDTLNFPAQTFTHFFKAHGLLSITHQPQWYSVTGGSQHYVSRLTGPFKDRIHTNCGVTAVTRRNGKIRVTDSTGATLEYDDVIFACHADQALAILQDATPEEREILGAFRYSTNKAILHNDVTIMPKRKLCWSSWIYHSEKDSPKGTIPITYWMNLLQGIDANYPLFVTLNPHRPIAPEHIFDEHIFEHPIYSPESVAAQARIPELQGKQNTWFCGAHLRNGFHEDGIASAVSVAKSLGATIPWL